MTLFIYSNKIMHKYIRIYKGFTYAGSLEQNSMLVEKRLKTPGMGYIELNLYGAEQLVVGPQELLGSDTAQVLKSC